MKHLRPSLYKFLKDYEHLYKLGIVPFGVYLKMRGWYNAQIRPVPKK